MPRLPKITKDQMQEFIATRSPEMMTAFADFLEMRASIKKPMRTDGAKLILLNKLRQTTDREDIWIEMLENSIEMNWQTVWLTDTVKLKLKEVVKPVIQDERPEITEEMREKNKELLKQMKYDLLRKSQGN